MRALVSSALCGVIFGIGLLVSGMADPARVLGFFDVFGLWDPSLAFVMGGGLAVAAPGFWLVGKRTAPTCVPEAGFCLPPTTGIDARLIGGAALFGIGWGIGGFCPGPALVSAAAGFGPAVIFSGAMVAGMLLWRGVEAARRG